MDSNQLPRDVLMAARERAVRAQAELDAARQQARIVAEEKDWLAERTDLQELESAFREADRCSNLYLQASARLTDIWLRARIQALSPRWGRGEQAIDRVIEAYHALRRHVTDGPISTILRLDAELDPASKLLLSDILKAASDFSKVQHFLSRGPEIDRFVHESIDAFVNAETRERQVAYESSVIKAADARIAVVAQFRQRLAWRFAGIRLDDFVPERDDSLRLELENIKTAHGHKQQEEENRRRQEHLAQVERERLEQVTKQERAWWGQILTQPIEAVIERLDKVPADQVETVLGRLLSLSGTDSHLHKKNVHDFLGREHRRLLQRPALNAPVVVAHISRLVVEREDIKARELLDMFPTGIRSTLDGVVAYLRFVMSTPERLTGKTNFTDARAK